MAINASDGRRLPQSGCCGDPLLGATISHYRIIQKLCQGGMGVVYKAEDSRLQRYVTLKFLSDEFAANRDISGRFQREARAGETGKAKVASGNFLELWKNADPHLPVLKQARSEFAKLQRKPGGSQK